MSVEFLQLRLQRFEVADSLLKGRVWAQRLQLHKVSADVVETHVSESASEMEGKTVYYGFIAGSETFSNTTDTLMRLVCCFSSLSLFTAKFSSLHFPKQCLLAELVEGE